MLNVPKLRDQISFYCNSIVTLELQCDRIIISELTLAL